MLEMAYMILQVFGRDGIMEWIGKNVLIIFEDGKEHISKKIGFIKDQNDIFVSIKCDGKSVEAIPVSRIIRMEVVE